MFILITTGGAGAAGERSKIANIIRTVAQNPDMPEEQKIALLEQEKLAEQRARLMEEFQKTEITEIAGAANRVARINPNQ